MLSTDGPVERGNTQVLSGSSTTALGTIRIQKAIESASGHRPYNPADPDLSGFVFDVLDASTQVVVATLVTDDSGSAFASLESGSYDVIETDSQGLTDVTSSAWVMVSEGQTTDVHWINRQSPLSGIRIQKAIESASGHTPYNPADPDLSGFVFDVLDASTQAVVATLVTDDDGSAFVVLAPGSYDVIETDSQGLTDVTSSAWVMVSEGQTTDVHWINRQSRPSGIRIQKAIESTTGGPPDNPADPDLSGFVFDVLEASTQAVVATLVTNDDGTAFVSLRPGSYDVIETDSQGLTDVTSSAWVMVSESQTTDVHWINRQAPLSGIRIQKEIESATGGPPDNPADPDLSGFVFDVLEASTQVVVATLVTGGDGAASVSLPPGSYDVVETDSRGLTDVTESAWVMVSEGETTDVHWINRQLEGRGTIEIEKTVVDESGEAVPDAPLDGFVFEVRTAGTQTVDTTLVTDETGFAYASLDPGSYDVVETDSKGLRDVTGPAGSGNDLVVVADDTTTVRWMNKVVPPGTLRIEKRVVDRSGEVVADEPLGGFVFEVRTAGTQTVDTTLVTDETGLAYASLEPGSYDVVETDSRGLRDVTGPTGSGNDVVVVANDTTTVAWSNVVPSPGTLRIEKTVVTEAGEPAEDPDLSNFRFDVRRAGTQTVVAMLVTDANGIAAVALEPGSYDVVETDSRGLRDVTGPTGSGNDVVVVANDTTTVAWSNVVPSPGTLRIEKTVVTEAGEPAEDPDLSNFRFDVRRAGTQTVVAMLVTDANGIAAVALEPGSYDVVETDSQGFTDLTGPTGAGNDVVVVAGDTTTVSWVNVEIIETITDVEITKEGPVTAEPGDQITYTLAVRNLSPDTARSVVVIDTLPPEVQLVSAPEGWTLNGLELRSESRDFLTPGDSVTYTVTVTPTTTGTIRNVVWVTTDPPDSDASNNHAELVTRVRISPFSDEGLIVGKVYHAGSGDSVGVDCGCEPDKPEGGTLHKAEGEEVGIPGVRVYLQDGTSAVTDSQGRYHFFGLRPRLWIVKVDETTLPAPESAYLVPVTNRHAGDGYSAFVDLKRSELARADFADGSGSAAVAEETAKRRTEVLLGGSVLGRTDRLAGSHDEIEPLFYSHLLPVAGQRPEDSGARPPVPQASMLPAAPEPRRSVLATGLLEARLDVRSLADGDLGLARGRDRFEDELRSFQEESDDGQVSAGARAALFLKGTTADDYELTLRLESEETEGSRLFRDIRPDELYPVYGDGSVREFDAQSKGRVFGRVQRGASYLMFGDFNTGLGSYGQTGSRALGQYSRTLHGVLEHFENERVAFNGFASQDRFSQIVDELPGEGISGPYQLTRTDGLINSEKVELITRDRDQPAVILSTQAMERFTDYTIEPFSGRLIFKQPISGLDSELNPVSIRVTYEAEGGGNRFWVYGADGQVRPWQRVELGGGFVRDENPLDEFDLASLNATVDLGLGTFVFGELARTDGSTAGTGDASRLGLRHASGRLDASMLFLDTDETFNNPSAAFGTGRQEFNLRAAARLNDKTRLLAEALRTEDRVTGGTRKGGRIGLERALNEWLDGQLSYRHADETETPATDQSADTPNEVNSVAAKLTARPPRVENLAVSAEFESDVTESDQRRAWVGAEYDVLRRGRVYARHEFINSLSGVYGLNPEQERNSTVFGVSAAYRSGQTLFSEYRVRDAIGGREAQAAIGLRNTWEVTEGTRLSASAERLAPLTAGGATATALTGGVELTGDSLWLGSVRAEYWDRSGADQFFGSVGYGRKINSDLTFLGNSFFSTTIDGDRGFARTRLGLAWREAAVSRWNGLARYEHRYDADPRAVDGETRREAHIFWGHLSYRPTAAVIVRGTAASKRASGEQSGIDFEERAQLLGLRSTFDVTDRVDVGLIGRTTFSDFIEDADYGLGAEVGVLLADNLRLAAGYNVFGFNDAEFSDHEPTDYGFYIHLGFKFDEALFGRRRGARPPAHHMRLGCPPGCAVPAEVGAIRLQKKIKSHDGGPPDNPEDPSLSGFVFEIRIAGTQTIVDTMVTDREGIASVFVEPGIYDVVEVDSQGLIDVTGPTGSCDELRVLPGQISRVVWTNRQTDEGLLTLRKEIRTPDGSEATGVPLQDFEFEVRVAGTDTVVDTLVTNTEGIASARLEEGAYDISETDSKGLIDLTGPRGEGNDLAVVPGDTTTVRWTNQVPPPGTLRIEKTVVNEGGDLAGDIDLSNFRFEVRRAGTQIVVGTMVTDSTGVASASIEPGNYDIVETDSKGLTDLTGPNGVSVEAAETHRLEWINICCPERGTITIQKTIEPPGSSPAGFEFRVLEPGTNWVVATLVTDSSGTASETLPVGRYDIVETFMPVSGELTDATGPVIGVEVVADQETVVPWINRVPTGTVTIQKTILASDSSVANNPTNPSLAGFEFEVLVQGTDSVVTTMVTNGSGMASDTLPVGQYVIVETFMPGPGGLTDATGPVTGVEVVREQNTSVPWTNLQPPDTVPTGPVHKRLLEPDTVGRGETVAFTIHVTGPESALSDTVEIRDLLPAAELIYASGGPTRTGSTLTWPRLPLSEWRTRTDTVVVRLPEFTGRVVNLVTITRDSTIVEDSTTVSITVVDSTTVRVMVADSAPALDVSILGPSRARYGARLTYQVRITNWSDSLLTNVRLTDTLSTNSTFLGRSGEDTPTTQTVIWTIPPLEPGGILEYEIELRAPSDSTLISVRAFGSSTTLSDRSTAYTLIAGECSFWCRVLRWICQWLPWILGLLALALILSLFFLPRIPQWLSWLLVILAIGLILSLFFLPGIPVWLPRLLAIALILPPLFLLPRIRVTAIRRRRYIQIDSEELP